MIRRRKVNFPDVPWLRKEIEDDLISRGYCAHKPGIDSQVFRYVKTLYLDKYRLFRILNTSDEDKKSYHFKRIANEKYKEEMRIIINNKKEY
jgi:hypothetical protein